MRSVFDYTQKEWESTLESAVNVPKKHAITIIKCLYKKCVFDLQQWESFNLPKKLILYLKNNFYFDIPQILALEQSKVDGCVKLLLGLEDKNNIECVIIPDKKRITLCVSTQVGCNQACKFCQTGKFKLIRNLEVHEIVKQWVIATLWIRNNSMNNTSSQKPFLNKITNLVFMGMGEPLENVDNVAKAIQIFTNPFGCSLGFRHISVSTCGHLNGLDTLLECCPNVSIAISLNAVNDQLRNKIMPINKKWPISQLINAIKKINAISPIPVLIQYVLIEGLNDSLEDAKKLCELLEGLNVKINLIPYNPIAKMHIMQKPHINHILSFYKIIKSNKFQVTIRFSKGEDISAACGQLYYKNI